jgi:hypothetical protein
MWLTRIAGKFKLRGVAKIEGSEVMSDETDVEVKFPTFAQITGDPKASGLMRREWAKTLKDCKDKPGKDYLGFEQTNLRRERGFFIQLDTRANKYLATNRALGGWVGPWDGGIVGLGKRPPDEPETPEANAEGAKYVVASFHTHTPTTFLPYGGKREVGPSPTDDQNNTDRECPGVVYDFEGSPLGSNKIPTGHPKESAAKCYPSPSKGLDRRPTP